MDGIISWVNDKKNLPIVIAGLAIIIGLVLVVLKMTGKIGGGAATTTTEVSTNAAGGTGAEGMAPTAGAMGTGTIPGMMPGMMGSSGGTEQVSAPAAPRIKLPPMLPYRKDPFVQIGGQPTKRDALIAKLPSIGHPRLAVMPVSLLDTSASVENMPQQPTRRLAGILYNSRVSAILETNGVMDIITPGMVLDRGNSRVLVESIQKNAVVLKLLDTKKPMRVVVALAGSPNAASSDNSANTGGGMPGMLMPGGMPGMPGGMPGMPGMPTMPGGMPGMMMPGMIGN
ncbi:MAG: hypothetical protein ACYC0V_17735 [Armatimonadota bacterium]